MSDRNGSGLDDVRVRRTVFQLFTGYRPEAASQLAEMTHPNRPFISASEGQQVLISMAATSATIG